ncbi:hypothetical protein [Paenibacillus gansuensis]|uniref:Uncharacterized protein n=1 Tax=Paenibacillus gansuensis TaxID=306542 RepID=A0ABW5PB38_9BACL
MVFAVNRKLVIKLPINLRGFKSIKREIDIFSSSRGHLKRHLAKIVDYSGGWILMKKMDRKMKRSREYRKRLSRLKENFKDAKIIPRDTRWDNLRRNRNGKIIFIDYGNFKKR